MGIIESYPNIQATVVDLPSTVPITRKYVQAAGASDRVEAIARNVVEGTFSGSYYVAVLSNFIHVLSGSTRPKSLATCIRVGGGWWVPIYSGHHLG